MAKGVTVHFRYLRNSRYYLTIDGPFPDIHLWLSQLEAELPVAARALPSPPSQRIRLRSAVEILSECAIRVYDLGSALGEVGDLLDGTPNSFIFDAGRATHVTGVLRIFTKNLLLFHQHVIDATSMAESARSTLEVLFRASLGPGLKDATFAQMVERAAASNFIRRSHVPRILQLKDHRRDAKHRGQLVTMKAMSSILEDVIGACQELCQALRQGAKGGA